MGWEDSIGMYFVGASLVMAYIACNAVKPQGKENMIPPLWVWVKPLFLFASLFTLVAGFANLRFIGSGAGATAPASVLAIADSAYSASMFVYIGFAGLFIAIFLYEIFTGFRTRTKEQNREAEGDEDDVGQE